MNKKKHFPIVIVVLLLIALGIYIKYKYYVADFVYAGTLEATKIDIPARVSSVIAKRLVNEGDKVQPGQTLMELACEDYKLAAKIANDNFARAQRLYRQGSEARETFDQVQNKKQESDLRISWCNVTAPTAGTILNKYHEPGEMVTPGTRLFTMANLDDIYAYIYVPQKVVPKIKLGQQITGLLAEDDNRHFPGVITHINEEAEFTPKNVQTREERTRLVFGIKISFENKEGILKPGMTLEVNLPEESR